MPCSEVFTEIDHGKASNLTLLAIENAYCADPQDTITLGNYMFGINKIAKLVWEPCQRRTDDEKPEFMPI